MNEIDISHLQRWLTRQFSDVGRRLLMVETAVNDVARTQATSGEIEAIHTRLDTIEQRISRLELGERQ